MRGLELFIIKILVASAAFRAEDTARNDVTGECKLPLGMEEGRIPDDAITASSSYETKSVGPQNARIRQEKNGGAWCPKAQISSDIREYLEVDLTKNHLITWTETQGRFGNGQGQEYAESFFLEYWRESQWHPYKTPRGDRILRGNSNTYLVVQQRLDLPFVASRVRFVPYSQHPRTVCMRVEIFGCVWQQRIRRYDAPRGESFGPEGANVEDLSYDGEEDGDYLVNGLGQLTDGIIGEDPYSVEASGWVNWIGWTDRNPISIVIEFADVRDFESVTLHLANAPEKGIEPFATARTWFSRDGNDYGTREDSNAEAFDSTTLLTTARRAGVTVITMDLRSRTGRFVRLELAPSSKWLLLSEITFQSAPAPGNSSYAQQAPGEDSNRNYNETETMFDVDRSNSGNYQNETYREINSDLTPDAFPVNNSQTYIGLASGALMIVGLFLACTFFVVKLRGRNKVALLQKHTALLCGSPAPGINVSGAKRDGKLSASRGIVNGSLSRSSTKSRRATAGTLTAADCATIGSGENNSSNEYEQCSIYERTYRLFSEENLAYERYARKNTEYTDVTGVTSQDNLRDGWNTEAIVKTPFPVKRQSSVTRTPKSNSKIHEGYYAATDILTIKRRERHAGSSLFTSLDIDECARRLGDAPDPSNVRQISRHRLRILDKIGEGSFGFVHLCEAKGIQSPDRGTARNRQVVVVRSLWRGVTDSFKKLFMKDMYVLAEIRDENIARVIALVEEEPFGAVFEYGELGDLPSFMRDENRRNEDERLGHARLLDFVTQIASGMKYLEALSIAHCDLAARNCIVSKNLVIKVSDHAMYCSKYDGEYYVNECYAKIPLRWMAWEAVLLGKRSCRSDVWSYATTVWEILTRCDEMPYSEMTSEQVLENCSRWYHSDVANKSNEANKQAQRAPAMPAAPRYLQQPDTCSRELYRLMTSCWSKRPEDRPTFHDIHLSLERPGFD